jgi:hypothetical protein
MRGSSGSTDIGSAIEGRKATVPIASGVGAPTQRMKIRAGSFSGGKAMMVQRRLAHAMRSAARRMRGCAVDKGCL